MTKVIWLSRHDMTQEQRADLARRLGDEISVESENVTWANSADEAADRDANWDVLTGLFQRHGHATLAGVFPPVALEALRDRGIRAYTPVSQQSAELRADGTRQIAFQHLRWSRV